MDGKKEWFTLQETAALLERTGPNGQLLTGYEAEQAVLKLVFEESDGERFPLIPAVRFDSHILIKRYLSRLDRNSEGRASLDYGAKIKGYWPSAGFPRKRFRYLVPPPPYCVHPFQVTTAPENPVEFTGLLNLWLYGQPRRIDGKIILDKSGINPAAAFPHSGILWYDPAFHEYPKVHVMAFEKVVVEGIEHRPTCKTINENELVITRRSLTRYAADHGYINTLRLIAGDTGSEQATGLNIVDVPVKSLIVPLAPPAEDLGHVGKEEQEDDSRNKGGRPPGFLTEALQCVYQQCVNRNDTSILEPHQLNAFLKHLKKLAGGSKNNKTVSEYIQERIKLVQPSNPIECIKTQDQRIKPGVYREGKWYSQVDVSIRMSTIRSKIPLPPLENITKPTVSESQNRGL